MMSEFDALSALSSISNLIGQQPNSNPNPIPLKKKRNLPGTPDPEAEVIAMSPKSLMAKNRFLCEICNKGFQRDQNLQLHRRGHNLPWKLRQRTSKEVRKKVYVCPEKNCVHHDPLRALGDLTGIKKHYSRKHGEKKWKCEKCSKKYAVQSDWKAHSKICGTKEYKCDCGTLFSRKDSFITHRAFCDALAEDNARFSSVSNVNPSFKADHFINETIQNPQATTRISQFSSSSSCSVFQPNFASPENQLVGNFPIISDHGGDQKSRQPQLPLWLDPATNPNAFLSTAAASSFSDQSFMQEHHHPLFGSFSNGNVSMSPFSRKLNGEEETKATLSEPMTASLYSAHMSATALLQKAAQMGSTRTSTPAILFNTNTAAYVMNPSALLNAVTPTSNSCHLNQKIFPQRQSESDSMNQLPDHRTMNPLMAGAKEERGQSLTRDFLGVGNHNATTGPFLQHDHLVHLAPMSSNGVELSQYTENRGH